MTAIELGPESLPQMEDRLLFHLVELTGDRPLAVNEGVSEADLAIKVADELGISPDAPTMGNFHSSAARMTVLAGVENLERDGLVQSLKVMGPWTIRPTRDGRSRVADWRKKWDLQRKKQDHVIEQAVLSELDRIRRENPERYRLASVLDVEGLLVTLDVPMTEFLANAQRLLDQGKIALHQFDQATLSHGDVHITEAGVQTLEATHAAERPRRDAQEAWVEVARLKRELQLAQRTLPLLISDDELRERCEDLLSAQGNHDRVIREACVVLENRVRRVSGADKTLTGTKLMEQAFSPKAGSLRLSSVDQEQVGAMELYRGVMAFFRNAAGHRLEQYSQDDALRVAVFVDHLLRLIDKAKAGGP